jgi:exosortase
MHARWQLPGSVWLLLPVVALWPLWQWSASRLFDGSDDPFGILALLALLLLLGRERALLLPAPRPSWLLGALLLSACATFSAAAWPMLLRAALGVCAVMAGIQALRQPAQPRLAWFGLAVLALPLLASLQFFLGYPLRVITAEVSSWLLQLGGVAVERRGSTLQVAGQLVMVDAPCSGIQMIWVAYFTAFFSAAWWRVGDASLLRRLPLLGALVLVGNILRNSVLVMLESGQWQGAPWLHEGVGLLVFAVVCLLVLRLMAGAPQAASPAQALQGVQALPGRPLLLAAFAGLACWPLLGERASAGAPQASFVEWPQQFEGRPLQPLALSEVEQRFAAGFPGAIARFDDGERLLSLRHVTRPSRKLHPAADCYRALGFVIERISLQRRVGNPGLQRCFTARDGQSVQRVCEYIEDAAGQSFSDTSAWYWAALSGRSAGPWLAVTTATVITAQTR